MSYTEQQVAVMVTEFGHSRYVAVEHVAHEGEPDGISADLLLAVGVVESGLRNIVGDGGHGRGWLQQDDRSFLPWLRLRAGCRSGSWEFAPGHRASEPGYCPGLVAAADHAVLLLRGNAAYAKQQHVPAEHQQRFALAAYNCGAGNAIAAYREHGIGGIDARTANRHYSELVLMLKPMVHHAVAALAWR